MPIYNSKIIDREAGRGSRFVPPGQEGESPSIDWETMLGPTQRIIRGVMEDYRTDATNFMDVEEADRVESTIYEEVAYMANSARGANRKISPGIAAKWFLSSASLNKEIGDNQVAFQFELLGHSLNAAARPAKR